MATATYKAEKKNIQGVLSWYEDQQIANFRIYAGYKPVNEYGKYEYLGNDKSEGMELLEKYLHTIQEDNNTNKYSLHLVPKSSKTFSPSITFQFNEGENILTPAIHNYSINNELLSRLAAIENKLNNIEDEDEDEEPEDNSFLSGITKDPQMKEVIYTLIGKLAGNMFNNNAQGIAGVPDDNSKLDIEEILKELYSKGVTIEDLKILSEFNKMDLTYLLAMLRNKK